MPLNLPADIAYDLRTPVLGDSFGWSGIEPGSAKSSIVIHATASDGPNEDGFTIADYHVNHNGWGGAGVHTMVTKDSYPGRPQYGIPAGAGVQYIGDLYTYRAGTLNQNPTRIHHEISGLFTAGNGIPSEAQLRKTRALIDHLLFATPELPSLRYYSQVTYHNAVKEQNTACPGWNHPSFGDWFAYLQGGAFPDHLYAPVSAPVLEPVTLPEIVEPTGQTNGVIPITVIPPTPEWELSYVTQAHQQTVLKDGAKGTNPLDPSFSVDVPKGYTMDVAGYYTFEGNEYARSTKALADGTWNGLDVTNFLALTGQPSGEIPVTVAPVDGISPQQIVQSVSAWRDLWEAIVAFVAHLIKRKQ